MIPRSRDLVRRNAKRVHQRNGNGHNRERTSVGTDKEDERSRKIREAVYEIFRSAKYMPVLERFRYTYEYRRDVPWLLESGNFPGREDGLAWAVYDALDLYEFGRSYRRLNLPGRSALDEGFLSRLSEAVEAVTNIPSNVEDFARSLARAGCDLGAMSTSELCQHIARALDDYCSRGRSNIENAV